MTIAVTIENKDEKLTVEVLEKNYFKDAQRFEIGSPYAIGPGGKHTFYCYHLRDLIIREQDQNPRG